MARLAGICSSCDDDVMLDESDEDYDEYYCINPYCDNSYGELVDMGEEMPDWVEGVA